MLGFQEGEREGHWGPGDGRDFENSQADKTFIHFMNKCLHVNRPGSYPGTYQHTLYTQRQELPRPHGGGHTGL